MVILENRKHGAVQSYHRLISKYNWIWKAETEVKTKRHATRPQQTRQINLTALGNFSKSITLLQAGQVNQQNECLELTAPMKLGKNCTRMRAGKGNIILTGTTADGFHLLQKDLTKRKIQRNKSVGRKHY